MNIYNLYKDKISFEIRSDIELFSKIATEMKLEIYMVGGAVRDILIGRTVTDIDIMVEGDATYFAGIVREKTGGKLLIHDTFFTAVLFLPSGRKYDFTSCRKEYYPYPGSLPITSPGSVYDDLYRRDFTINAIAMHLSEKFCGEIVDYFNGIQDIENRIIRILHDSSFISDPTRIFRALRFEAKLSFNIDEKTIELAIETIKMKVIDRVSGERIYNEIRQICNQPFTNNLLNRINLTKILTAIYVNWRMPGCVSYVNIEKTLNESPIEKPYLFRLSWLFSEIEKNEDLQVVYNRLRMSNKEKKYLLSKTEIKSCLLKIKNDCSIGGIDIAFNKIPDDMIFLISEMVDNDTKKKINEYLRISSTYKTLITGNDLINIGLSPGKNLNKIIKHLRYMQLNGDISEYNQAIYEARKIIVENNNSS